MPFVKLNPKPHDEVPAAKSTTHKDGGGRLNDLKGLCHGEWSNYRSCSNDNVAYAEDVTYCRWHLWMILIVNQSNYGVSVGFRVTVSQY